MSGGERFFVDSNLLLWDALILSAAQRYGSAYVLSEDFQSGDYAGTRVLNPFEHSPASLAAVKPAG